MDIDRLRDTTDVFLNRHWSGEDMPPKPRWSDPWRFTGTISDFDSPGCYSLFARDQLLYVGVTSGPISGRTSTYTRMAEGGRSFPTDTRPYVPVQMWAERGLDCIRTLAIPKSYWYLSGALELYLISELKPPPPWNVQHKKDA
jgi:hypothetical protein